MEGSGRAGFPTPRPAAWTLSLQAPEHSLSRAELSIFPQLGPSPDFLTKLRFSETMELPFFGRVGDTAGEVTTCPQPAGSAARPRCFKTDLPGVSGHPRRQNHRLLQTRQRDNGPPRQMWLPLPRSLLWSSHAPPGLPQPVRQRQHGNPRPPAPQHCPLEPTSARAPCPDPGVATPGSTCSTRARSNK